MKKEEVYKIIETMAEAGCKEMIGIKWDENNEIEKEAWIDTTKAMLMSLKFPTMLYQVCQYLDLNERK